MQGIDHGFDSSQTCDYCGIPAESPNAKGPCQKRALTVSDDRRPADVIAVFGDVARRLEDLGDSDRQKVLQSLCVLHGVDSVSA